MEVFHCEVPAEKKLPSWNGPCTSPAKPKVLEACKRVLAAWAMGALPFTYPEEAGLPIGGPEFSRYVMLEVHYNNPELKDGVVDSSGITLTYTPSLRDHDAGVMELGLEYTNKMAIPPHQPDFTLTGYCVAECTRVGFPAEGIVIFGSQLHTHLTGIKVYTKHIRGSAELPELNRDNHYSTHFQEIRRLKRKVRVLPSIAIRIHFSHCADENMLAQPIIFHWVVPECTVTVCVIVPHKIMLDADVLFQVDIFQPFATYCVPFVENRTDLMLQNTNAVLANVHPQVWLHVALLCPQHVFMLFSLFNKIKLKVF
ncbi:tyramine beta-hydroxylase [Trichonephila clavipes]|nr:tyramine beta-hydroxylase [Trichonephila clavipes]